MTATSVEHCLCDLDNRNASCNIRRDECERVKVFGARVLTLDQVYGVKDPSIECWGTEEEDGGDPPRLWAPNGNYPGTAFTRSIGDNGMHWLLGTCAANASYLSASASEAVDLALPQGIFLA